MVPKQQRSMPGIAPDSGLKGKSSRFEKAAIASVLVGTLLLGTGVGVATEVKRDPRNLPCRPLVLPDVPGAEALEKNLCVSVAGEQPRKIGVKQAVHGDRVENTLLLEWPTADGTEPVTLVTSKAAAPGASGASGPITLRSRLQERTCDLGELPRTEDGMIPVALANRYELPAVGGCRASYGFMGAVTAAWGRVAGIVKKFVPLRPATENELPGHDNPKRL